ncbi:two-component system histidine kinase PnpS [Pseudobacteroides cellulosolvens]|uniref:histidine kinase n=1 Tax=Pseudobacteroides cellulosolvens ATCC 35603 = DSM 2933 TaxID=398512 RepID=A0A0L6JMQ1_9FIRM|nr:HAMP domain-containing sensor histidine kinase [Pseudobacteroides cellulosolvens]KNY27049.1 integral membrane sensor signal transduction histidine kinase [Pseudobacteroides cellulosolvens ATCC 35603 = DSM 2933]
MKQKIFLYYLVLTVIGVFITGLLISEISQKYYKYELEEKLISTARLIQFQLSENKKSGVSIDYNKIAQQYADILYPKDDSNKIKENENYLRITFIDKRGIVIGESEMNYLSMDNHSNRKEVKEALKGQIGKDIRFSKDMQISLLYIAVPMTSEGIIIRVSVPLIQLETIDEIILIYTGIGILAGTLLTTILAFRFSNMIIKPVNELIDVTKDISEGNFSRRSNIICDNEIEELSNTFNLMAEKLESTLAEMNDKNIKIDSIINSMISGVVAVDNNFRIMLINTVSCQIFGIKYGPGIIGMNLMELIGDNKINNLIKESIDKNTPLLNEVIVDPKTDKIYRVYTSPINSNNTKQPNSGGIASIHDITNIKKLEQIRTEFVSNVTHELKTPLTSIRGFIETLKSGAIDDKTVAVKFLDIIDIESERLSNLINDILQLSEIENTMTDSDISCHNINDTFKEIYDILEGVAEKKGIKLHFEIENYITIDANKNRIKQMLINLVDNAIKYNKDNGTVTIKAIKKEGTITFTIKDTGIGIDEEHIPRIFERFYRVDKGRSRNMGGTGLGLSIVKHIVNLYNGSINVTSKPGSGTEFIIQLPI